MARSIELLVRIAVDAANAGSQIDQAASAGDRFKSSMGTLAIPAAAAAGAVALFGKGAIDAASTAQQAIGATEAVFGSASQSIITASQNSANQVGLSAAAYQTMAASVGGALTGMGVPLDQAAQSTQDLMTRSADLASVFGGTTAQAADAMTSAFRGEYDALQRLIPGMSGAAVEAQMTADATAGLTFASEDAAKAHAITTVIMDKSAAAAGNFAKESDTAEGAAQRQAAAMDDAQAAIGQGLLPAYTALQGVMSAVGGWMQQNSTLVLVLAGVLGGLAVAVLAVNAAIAIAEAATALWAAAQWVLNAAMDANPVVLIVIAIVALVAGIILLWNNCEAFRTFILAMWEAISSAATAAWNGIMAVAQAVISAVSGAVSAAGSVITGVWQTIQSVASSVWNAISSLVSSVVSGISSAVSGIIGGITGAWDSIRSSADSAWNSIKSLVSTVTGAIAGAVSGIQGGIEAVWSAIQRAGEAVWRPIQSAAEAAMGVIMGVINSVMSAISGIGSAIQSAIGWAGDLLGKILGAGDAAASVPGGTAVMSVGGFAAAQSPSLARSGLLATPSTRAAAAGSGGVTITVNGALDPDAVARQIDALLRRRGRRTGGTVL
jgi:phage-related protein